MDGNRGTHSVYELKVKQFKPRGKGTDAFVVKANVVEGENM